MATLNITKEQIERFRAQEKMKHFHPHHYHVHPHHIDFGHNPIISPTFPPTTTPTTTSGSSSDGGVTAAIGSLALVSKGAAVALLANPITWAVVGVAAVGYLLYKLDETP